MFLSTRDHLAVQLSCGRGLVIALVSTVCVPSRLCAALECACEEQAPRTGGSRRCDPTNATSRLNCLQYFAPTCTGWRGSDEPMLSGPTLCAPDVPTHFLDARRTRAPSRTPGTAPASRGGRNRRRGRRHAQRTRASTQSRSVGRYPLTNRFLRGDSLSPPVHASSSE